MKRIVTAALSCFLAGTFPALAGDTAELNILGFSADGAIFAFEEYGVQDGSGFPYANRFYIDTATDSFVAGSPIRKRIDDETATVDQVRAEAATEGQAIVGDSELAAHRGTLAGFNAVSELSADPHRMAVNPRPVVPPIDEPFEVRLAELPFAPGGNCEGVTDVIQGFRLTSVDVLPGGTTRLLHEDSSIPASRGCPLGYRLSGVQTYYPDSGTPVAAILIAVRSFGFEGPDYRWMAVTAPIEP